MKLLFPLFLSLLSPAFASTSSYLVENLSFPDDMPPEIGGLAFDGKGNLYACLRRGDIVVTQPGKDSGATRWKVFATGLHNPMGMQWVGPGRLVVSQMAELTEIIDTDGDGTADRYNNLSTAFGISGNYHETNAICPDGDGGYYVALGTASHTAPPFSHPVVSIRKRVEEEEIFPPTIYGVGWSVTTKTESLLLLRAAFACTTGSPAHPTGRSGAETTRETGAEDRQSIMFVQAPSTGTLPVYAGIRICRRLERPFSSPEKCSMTCTTSPRCNLLEKA